MNDKLTIKVNIAGRSCPFTIDPKEEEDIRTAARMINSKISQYREKYSNIDPMDLLAATALQFTVLLLEEKKKNNIEPMLDEIKKTSHRLDVFIKE